MPLFRFHRGGYNDSIATTVIVSRMPDLIEEIKKEGWIFSRLRIKVYPDKENCFDPRCGWFTRIVTIEVEPKKFIPVGFLSEDMP